MDSENNNTTCYSDGDSTQSSSPEHTTKPNATGYKLRLSLINKKAMPNSAHGGTIRRVNNDTNTKKKDPNNDIVDRSLAKIE